MTVCLANIFICESNWPYFTCMLCIGGFHDGMMFPTNLAHAAFINEKVLPHDECLLGMLLVQLSH